MILVPTRLPPGTVLYRHHPEPEAPFDWSVCVTEEDDGETLVLRGLTKLVPASVWNEARDRFYPKARRVRFERRTNGKSRWVTLPLK